MDATTKAQNKHTPNLRVRTTRHSDYLGTCWTVVAIRTGGGYGEYIGSFMTRQEALTASRAVRLGLIQPYELPHAHALLMVVSK